MKAQKFTTFRSYIHEIEAGCRFNLMARNRKSAKAMKTAASWW
jgi:hypothetical protein